MSDFQTEITGLEQVNADLTRMAQAGRPAQETVLHDLGGEYVAALIRATPRGQSADEDSIQGSYKTEESYTDSSGSLRITNTAPQLRYVLEGRGEVTVKSAKALRFMIGSTVIFRRSVGPAAPNNFPMRVKAEMQPKIEAAQRAIPDFIIKVFDA